MMSLLEERILRIIELQVAGKDEHSIAEELGIDVPVIRSYIESTKTALENALSYGERGASNIAHIMGISPVTLTMFAKQYNITIPDASQIRAQRRKRYSTGLKGAKIQVIRQAINEGVDSIEEIARRTELSPSSVITYAYKYQINLNLPKVRDAIFKGVKKALEQGTTSLEGILGHIIKISKREKLTPRMVKTAENVVNIMGAIEQGATSRIEIKRVTGMDTSILLRYEKRFGLMLPRGKRQLQRKPETDLFINEGMSLSEIGEKVGSLHQTISWYIQASGQHELWREKRHERKERELLPMIEERERKMSIVNLLRERITQLQENASWAEQKAAEYILLRRQKSQLYSPETLLRLFTLYEKAQRQGKKLSLDELSKKTGIPYANAINRVLREVGIKPMYGKHTYTPPIIKVALQRAEQIPMSYKDIGYFLNVPPYIAQKHFTRQKKKHRGEPIKIFGRRGWGGGYDALTWRKASEIYEAVDARFRKRDLYELLDTTPEVVSYALTQRERIEPVIVEALQILYNDGTITTPYYREKRNDQGM